MAKKPNPNLTIENFNIAGITWKFSPTGLILYAEYYLAAAKTAKADEAFNPARTFLVGHAIELALKALLAFRGVSLVELASGAFGHNLNELLKAAETQNLTEFCRLGENERAEIVKASEYYNAKVLEYPAFLEAIRGYPQMPHTDTLIAVAEKLVLAMKQPFIEAP